MRLFLWTSVFLLLWFVLAVLAYLVHAQLAPPSTVHVVLLSLGVMIPTIMTPCSLALERVVLSEPDWGTNLNSMGSSLVDQVPCQLVLRFGGVLILASLLTVLVGVLQRIAFLLELPRLLLQLVNLKL